MIHSFSIILSHLCHYKNYQFYLIRLFLLPFFLKIRLCFVENNIGKKSKIKLLFSLINQIKIFFNKIPEKSITLIDSI